MPGRNSANPMTSAKQRVRAVESGSGSDAVAAPGGALQRQEMDWRVGRATRRATSTSVREGTLGGRKMNTMKERKCIMSRGW